MNGPRRIIVAPGESAASRSLRRRGFPLFADIYDALIRIDPAWHFPCRKGSSHKEDPFSIRANPSRDGDAKPRVRTARLRAGLPKEGLWSTPRDTVVFLKGDHAYVGPAVALGFRLGPGCNAGCAASRKRRGPRRFLDRSHHEYRWQPADRPSVLSRLLRGLGPSVPGRDLRASSFLDLDPVR